MCNDEISTLLEYEASLWIDGIVEDTAVVFSKLLDTVQKITVQHVVMVSHAWQKQYPFKKMPSISFSKILSTALTGIASDPVSFSYSFISISCKIASKLLMHQSNTRFLLAAFIKHVFSHQQLEENNQPEEFHHSLKVMLQLQQDCEIIISNQDNDMADLFLNSGSVFGHDQFHSKICLIPKHFLV